MPFTRIRNNQVYNSDIDASTKIAPYSITGGLWQNNLTYNSNLTVGNLTVSGNAVILNTTNVLIADPLLSINKNQSGTPSYDLGFVMGRGSSTNVAFIWEETNQQFQLQYTTESTSATTTGVINNSGYANLQAYGALFNNATITSVNISNATFPNVRITGGYIDGTQIGANTPNSVVATTVTTSSGGQHIGYHTGAIGANTANTGAFTTVTTTGNLYGGGNIIAASGQTSSNSTTSGALVVSGSGGIGVGGNINAGGVVTAAGNIWAASGAASSNSTTAGALVVTGGVGISGNINSGGVVTAAGNIWAASGTASTSNTTGALVVTGGLGVSGAHYNGGIIYSAGNIVAASGTGATNTTSGAVTVSGGVGLSGALVVGSGIAMQGNGVIYTDQTTASVFNTNTTTLSIGNAATTVYVGLNNTGSVIVRTTGNSYGQGSGSFQMGGGFYAGGDSYIAGNLIVANITSAGYQQLISNAPLLYLEPNIAPYNYEIGFYSHKIDAIQGYNHTGFVRNHNDNAWYLFSNIRTEPTNVVDLSNAYIIYDTIKVGNVIALSGNAATSTTTGALVLSGGAGLSGALVVGSGIAMQGNGVIYTDQTTATLFNTTTTSINFGGAASGTIAVGSALGTVNISGKTLVPNLTTTGGQVVGYFNGPIGANGANTGVFSTITTTGSITSGTQVVGYFNGAIGANGTNTGAFSTVTTTSNLYAGGNIIAASGQTSTSTTVGAIVVSGSGGIGVGGAVNAGGNIGAPWINGTTGASAPAGYFNNIFQYSGTDITFNQGVTGNVVINSAGLNANVIVQGNTAASYGNLFTINGGTGQVGIKVAPNTMVANASLIVNSTDSIIIPAGSNGQRPGNGTAGMIRYNNGSNVIEYYNSGATAWQSIAGAYTTITEDSYVGNGSQTAFTISQSGTTNSVIVSINGIVQIPVTAYSVSGTTLTFTEAPLATDVIDIRTIASTSVITALQQNTTTEGVIDNGAGTGNVYTIVNNTVRHIANTATGGSNYFGGGIAPVMAPTALTQGANTVIDSFSASTFTGAKYYLKFKATSGAQQVTELFVTANATVANSIVSANTFIGGVGVANVGAYVNSGTVNVWANASASGSTATFMQIYMP